MVTIVGFEKKKSSKGGSFMVLKVEGGVQMQKGDDGKWYAAALKTNILASVDEATCKSLLGTELPGDIKKVNCMPYKYVVPKSGKEITMHYRYVYVNEEQESYQKQEVVVGSDDLEKSLGLMFSEQGAEA